MTRLWVGRLMAVALVVGVTGSVASADQPVLHAKAKLTGFHEVTPKLTDGIGTFSATVTGDALTYTLTYSGLSSPAFMAHLHFAQKGVNGGIFLWLCGSASAPGPAGTPTCPPGGGTVTRTVTAAAIVSPSPDQGLAAGDLAGAIRILRAQDAYANVHTTRYPGGEIRGQVRTEGEGESD